MASPRTPRSLFVLALATAATVSVLPASVGHADPRPSLSQVQSRVAALNAKVDGIVEEYASSRLELVAARQRAGIALSRVRAAQAELDSIKKSMSAIASAAYRTGGTDQFVQLVNTSTPQTFLDRASSLDRIAAGQSQQMAAAATARHRLAAVQAQAAQEQAEQQLVASRMAAQKRQIENALSEQKQLLGSLKAEERARYQASQRASARQAAAAARATRSRGAEVETYTGSASGRAAVAVQEAYRKLGSPYKWAAAGPDRFDCSGLTMWVWGKAGVSLPHSSRAQYAGGRKVSREDLQPGDLVYYGSPIHHVGIYVGNGRMISAPQTGDVVKLQNAFRRDYVGATRP